MGKPNLFLTLLIISSFPALVLGNQCLRDSEPSRDFDAVLLKQIFIETVGNVDVTWQAARGTAQLSVWATNTPRTPDITVDDDTINIRISDGSGAPVSTGACLALLLAASGLCHLVVAGERKWTTLVVLGLASVFTVALTQDCQLPTKPTVHLLVPTKYLEIMCVDKQCRYLLCPLSLTSEFR